MKKLFAIAAFLLASTAAQAQYTIDYNGQTIRIDPDRGTVSIPGVYDNTGKPAKRARSNQDSNRPAKPAPDQAKVDPQTPAPAPANTAPAPSNATANVAPANSPAPPAASAPAPQAQQDAVSTKPASPPVVATARVAGIDGLPACGLPAVASGIDAFLSQPTDKRPIARNKSAAVFDFMRTLLGECFITILTF